MRFEKLTARIQELQKEVICLNDSRDFKEAESVRSGLSHVPSQPELLPPFPDPGGMLSRSVGMPSRNDRPPDIWDTHGISGNVVVNPMASSSTPYPGRGTNPWIPNVSEHTSPHGMSERQTPDTALDPRCQSGPSARNSFDHSEGRFSKNYGAEPTTTADFGSSFMLEDKRSKTEVCTCSQFPSETMLWIKEVKLVDSVDDLRSSSSIRGISMPNFEVLDARIASAPNRIIHNSHFKRKVSLEEQKSPKKGRLTLWKTDRSADLQVLPGHRSQRFCRELRRTIYNCSSK